MLRILPREILLVNVDYPLDRAIEKICAPHIIYRIREAGTEGILQMLKDGPFAVEILRKQNGTTDVYVIDTTTNKGQTNQKSDGFIGEREADAEILTPVGVE